MKGYYRVMIWALFSLISCVDAYDTPSPHVDNLININRLITTEAGGHLVTLTYANQYSNRNEGNRLPVRNAIVSITDEHGNETKLVEELLTEWGLQTGVAISTGRHFTPQSFKANVGSTYTLQVALPDGQVFRSTPQTVHKVSPLDSVEVIPFIRPTPNPFINSGELGLLAYFNDPEDQMNYYMWNLSNSVIELITEPHLNSRTPLPCCNTCYVEDPDEPKFFALADDLMFDGLATPTAYYQDTRQWYKV